MASTNTPSTARSMSAQNPHPDTREQADDYFSTPHSQTQSNPESVRLYNLASANRWTRRELYRHIAPQVPIFVHCTLILPWVLASVLGIEAEKVIPLLTPATLVSGFERKVVKSAELPTIVESSRGRYATSKVQGMLLGCVQDCMLRKIEEDIGMDNHKQDVVEVEIKTTSGEAVVVAAYTYVWNGPLSALEDAT